MLKAILVTGFIAATAVAQSPSNFSVAEQATQTTRADPFIATIAAMKHSVAPVACLERNERETRIIQIVGTAFFVSQRGDFITAGHVIDLLEHGSRPCPIPAIFLPAVSWQPEVPEENFVWFPFKIRDCTIRREIDAAKCRPLADLSARRLGFQFTIDPVRPELARQPDGTEVAFTGFPLHSRDPLTSRAGIATYRTDSRGAETVSELILDHGAWAGGSGSPVYLANGRVIGMILQRGIDQGNGIAVVRPIESVMEMFAGH